MDDTKGADDEMDSLADSNALHSEGAVVPCGGDSEFRAQHRGYVEFAQLLLEQSRVSLSARTLQDFTEDDVTNQQRLTADD